MELCRNYVNRKYTGILCETEILRTVNYRFSFTLYFLQCEFYIRCVEWATLSSIEKLHSCSVIISTCVYIDYTLGELTRTHVI